MIHYLKYSMFHIMGLVACFFILLGGQFITIGLIITFVVFVLGDLVMGDDSLTPEFNHPRILDWQLWLAFPIQLLISFIALWQVADHDILGFGAAVEAMTGLSLLETRGQLSTAEFIGCIFLLGFNVGMVATVTAHELTHRTWDKVSMWIGRWLLAFSLDTSFAIEHVYGHHRYVSTEQDPATAPRGRNVYAHIILSTIQGNISAWNIEKQRLKKTKQSVFSYHNRVIRGYLMSLLLIAISYYLAGTNGLIIFLGAAIWGKSLLEIVNYMEHYGMVRDPNQPVEPRHSWNTNKRISSWALFNLTRHSHHHAQGEVPFYQLKPMPQAPQMISGYLGTILVALIPPLWHYLMTPKVLDWDKNYASEQEKRLIQKANQQSGIKAFILGSEGG